MTLTPMTTNPSLNLACGLYAQFVEDPLSTNGNILFSPQAAAETLALTEELAVGATQVEVQQALGWNASVEQAREHFVRQRRALEKTREGITVRSANGLWRDFRVLVGQATYERLFERFGTSVRGAAFEPFEQAVQYIDRWVHERTDGAISHIVSPRDIVEVGQLILINALSFQGALAMPFAPSRNAPRGFRRADGVSPYVRFMNATGRCSFFHDIEYGVSVLGLPYRDDRTQLIAMIPEGRTPISALEQNLSPDLIGRWLERMESREVEVSFPHLDLQATWNLEGALRAMGMEQAFDARAEFSGFDSGGIHLGRAMQKVALRVDREEGVSISAPKKKFRVSRSVQRVSAARPFLFMIWDRFVGTPLLMGRVMDPSNGAGDFLLQGEMASDSPLYH